MRRRRRHPGPRSPAQQLVRLSIPFYGLMSLGSVGVLAWWGELGLLGAGGESWWRARGLPADAPALVGLGLLLGWLVVVIGRRAAEGPWSRFLEERMEAALAGLRPGHALVLAVLSGVGEELLFRGVLQTWLSDGLGATGGWIAASLLFGAIHTGPDRRFLLWMSFSATVGLLLGAVFVATGSLLAPIFLHAGVNGMNLLVQSWEQEPRF